MTPDVKHMKWWGWGEEGVFFNYLNKPQFAPFVKKALDIDLRPRKIDTIAFDPDTVPDSTLPDDLAAALVAVTSPDQVSVDPHERVDRDARELFEIVFCDDADRLGDIHRRAAAEGHDKVRARRLVGRRRLFDRIRRRIALGLGEGVDRKACRRERVGDLAHQTHLCQMRAGNDKCVRAAELPCGLG